MTAAQLEAAVLAALGSVAPEVDDLRLDPHQPIRDQLDIDSMDFLNFMVALHEALGVEVPEQDYAEVASLDGCVRYLARKLGNR
jgi:acyl carrier protein